MSSRGASVRSIPSGGTGAHEPHPDRRLRVPAVLAAGATFLLIAVGGLVRATDSGLGCTGWPKCTADRWLPPLEHHALIEFSHRSLVVLVSVLVGFVAVVASSRRYRRIRRVFAPAWISVGFLIGQAVLGGIVVRGDLAAVLVTAHLGTAMLLVGSLVVTAVAAFSLPGRSASPGPNGYRSRSGRRFQAFAGLTAASVFLLILVGATVRAEGAGLAFPGWPLFDGAVVPRLSAIRPALHFAHRLLAAEAGILVAVLAVGAWRRRREMPIVARLACAAAGLFLAQVLAGAAAVWSRLTPAAIVVHVTLSSLVWGALVATAGAARMFPAAVRRDTTTERPGVRVALGSAD